MDLSRFLLKTTLGARLPTLSGARSVPFLKKPLWICRDRFGIPYIQAQNEPDAWFALGFCQAQDRNFQLQMLLRTIRGRLSEILGPRTLVLDRLTTQLQIHKKAKKQWEVQSQAIQTQLFAFSKGIKAGTSIPHELSLLRAPMLNWEPWDTLGVLMLYQLFLASNWDMELSRWKILQADGKKALCFLENKTPLSDFLKQAFKKTLSELTQNTLSPPHALSTPTDALPFQGGGSNAWVLGPSRTHAQRPILANDPHLAPLVPSQWYLASIQAPSFHLCGASFVGAPAIISGHNGHVAWGITAGFLDQVDLFLEKIDIQKKKAWGPRGEESCTVEQRSIPIRFRKPFVETLIHTKRGPVVHDVFEDISESFSFQALWLLSKKIEGFLSAPQAKTTADFESCFEHWPSLSLHVVCADTNNHIRYFLCGQSPKRALHAGRFPIPAWKAKNKVECLPFSENPRTQDPKNGFIVTANHFPSFAQPFSESLAIDPLDDFRAKQIEQLLQKDHAWTLEKTTQVQTDTQSILWTHIHPILKQWKKTTPTLSPRVQTALEFLLSWNGDVSGGSAPATVYELFLSFLTQNIYRFLFPKSWPWAFGKGFLKEFGPISFMMSRHGRILLRVLPLLLKKKGMGYLGKTFFVPSLQNAWSTYKTLDHKKTATWGHVRPLIFKHPFGELSIGPWSPFAKLFHIGPFHFGGDENTVFQGGINRLHPLGPSLATPTLRTQIEIGHWDQARFSIPTGQSGNPFSPHYQDLSKLWHTHTAISIYWSEEKKKNHFKNKLFLIPASYFTMST